MSRVIATSSDSEPDTWDDRICGADAASSVSDRLCIVTSEFTFSELASIGGVSSETARRYSNGAGPSVQYVIAIATRTGTSLDWLLLGIGPKRQSDRATAALADATASELCEALSLQLCQLVERLALAERSATKLASSERAPAGG